ncbi:hypothetical protein CALVIDRAFT_61329 [Calocera viscosa TUFC12733]|uniref:Uncharacterized protein n=1 Tax=Calocera viscosa (strain TUFC12733) TaxID=1330018 RepID=A0A167NLK8_CALVF|nr:hypothetical protein CALVIDRAFT_61329 [Calocera viscosa TUFC12733]
MRGIWIYVRLDCYVWQSAFETVPVEVSQRKQPRKKAVYMYNCPIYNTVACSGGACITIIISRPASVFNNSSSVLSGRRPLTHASTSFPSPTLMQLVLVKVTVSLRPQSMPCLRAKQLSLSTICLSGICLPSRDRAKQLHERNVLAALLILICSLSWALRSETPL